MQSLVMECLEAAKVCSLFPLSSFFLADGSYCSLSALLLVLLSVSCNFLLGCRPSEKALLPVSQ